MNKMNNPLSHFIKTDRCAYNSVKDEYNFSYKILPQNGQTLIMTGSLIKESDVPHIVERVLKLDKDYQKGSPTQKQKIRIDLQRNVLSDVRSDIEYLKRTGVRK